MIKDYAPISDRHSSLSLYLFYCHEDGLDGCPFVRNIVLVLMYFSKAYKIAQNQGKLSNLPTGWAQKIRFTIEGVPFEGSAIKLSDGSIRLDDFWSKS